MMKNLAIKLCCFFSAAFLVAAFLGFIPNPILGDNALFVTNTAHNLVHLATAVAFAVVALMGERISIRFMQVFGIVYMLVGFLGFMVLGSQETGHLLYVIHINTLDNYLHVGLGIAIAAAGWVSQNYNEPQIAANSV